MIFTEKEDGYYLLIDNGKISIHVENIDFLDEGYSVWYRLDDYKSFDEFSNVIPQDFPDGLKITFEKPRDFSEDFPFYIVIVNKNEKSFHVYYELTMFSNDNFLWNPTVFLRALINIIQLQRGDLYISNNNVPNPSDFIVGNEYMIQICYKAKIGASIQEAFDLGKNAIKSALSKTYENLIESFIPPTTEIGIINSSKHVFVNIKVEKELRIVLQQYLNFFSEFMEVTQRQVLGLKVHRNSSGLEIEFITNDISKIKQYFHNYISLLKQNLSNLRLDYVEEISDLKRQIFELELRNQIRHLENQLEIRAMKMKVVESKLDELESLILRKPIIELGNTRLSPAEILEISTSLEWDSKVLHFLKDNQILVVIDILIERFKNEPEIYQTIILLEARFNRLESAKARGIISPEDWNLEFNNLINAIMKLVENT